MAFAYNSRLILPFVCLRFVLHSLLVRRKKNDCENEKGFIKWHTMWGRKEKNIKSWGINKWESEMRNPICVCDYIAVAAMYWMSKDFSSCS